MTRWEKWLLNSSALLVSLTGVVYLWMKYGLGSDDPFSVINHPWQPLTLDLHILSAPVLILGVGAIFSTHIIRKLRNGQRSNGHSDTPGHYSKSVANGRKEGLRTGLVSLVGFLLMVFSGYLLQTAANAVLLRVALILHLLSGTLFAASYLVHLVLGIRLRRAKSPGRQEPRLPA